MASLLWPGELEQNSIRCDPQSTIESSTQSEANEQCGRRMVGICAGAAERLLEGHRGVIHGFPYVAHAGPRLVWIRLERFHDVNR